MKYYHVKKGDKIYMLKLDRVCVPLSLDCNLHCKYCYRDREKLDKIPEFTEDMKEYLRNLSPEWCEAVVASGGEPLMHFDKVKELFSYVPKNVHKKIMSNCTLLTQEIVNYINENEIELSISHDGPKTEFLRGVDILRNKKIRDLVRQVKTIRCYAVITKYNTNVWENYFDSINLLGRADIAYATTPLFDVTPEQHYLVEGFNYDEWAETWLQFRTSPFRQQLVWYDGATFPGFSDVSTKPRRNVGVNVLPDGTICGMIHICSKYGTIHSKSFKECEEKAFQLGLGNYCNKTNCKYIDRCDASLQHVSEHFCKCRMIMLDKWNPEYLAKVRKYTYEHLPEIMAKYGFKVVADALKDKYGYFKRYVRRIYLKFGTDCNLHCKYCHAEHREVVFNPKILPVLKEMSLEQIAFGGGEPLLYWDKIKEIVSYLGNSVRYKMVTNGTLFTQEIVDFCNQYRFFFYISADGLGSTRDESKPIRWDLIKQLKFSAVTTTFYKENANIRKTLESLNGVKENVTVDSDIYSSFPNFVHSTHKTGVLSDRALADSYINQMAEIADEALRLYKNGKRNEFVEGLFARFVKRRKLNGIRCCNDRYVSVLVDGTVYACPYVLEKIGDIFHLDEIDWKAVKEKYTRKGCSTCELFEVCGNSCWANITDDECYIMKKMHKIVVDLMKKYDISYEEMDKVVFG